MDMVLTFLLKSGAENANAKFLFRSVIARNLDHPNQSHLCDVFSF